MSVVVRAFPLFSWTSGKGFSSILNGVSSIFEFTMNTGIIILGIMLMILGYLTRSALTALLGFWILSLVFILRIEL